MDQGSMFCIRPEIRQMLLAQSSSLMVGCGVWSVGKFFIKTCLDSGCVGSNAGLRSHWDHPNPSEGPLISNPRVRDRG